MRFTNIDNEYTIFKKNKCIIWGTGQHAKECTNILNENNIEIATYCDNNQSMWNQEFNNAPVMTPESLKELCKKECITLLIASNFSAEISNQVIKNDIHAEYIISCDELYFVNNWKKHNATISLVDKNLKDIYINHIVEKYIHDWYDRVFIDLMIKNRKKIKDCKNLYLIHSAPKTGNNTIRNAMKVSMNVTPFNFCHGFGLVEPEWIDYIKNYPIKIITGLRDPVSQLLSLVYEMSGCYWDLPYAYNKDAASLVMKDIFLPYVLGTKPLDCFCTRLIDRKKESPFLLDFFDEQFKDFLDIDVFEYPFDKEHGYTVIKKGNIELFIYQLEKINSLESAIQEFLDNSSFKLHVTKKQANSAKSKFYSPYYKEFLSEYHLDENILDTIFSRKEIKHFYSEDDINKMKHNWL